MSTSVQLRTVADIYHFELDCYYTYYVFFLGSLFMSKSKKGSNNKPNQVQLWSNLREGLM